jgi:hypothetical protein
MIKQFRILYFSSSIIFLSGRKKWGILGMLLIWVLIRGEVRAQVQVYAEQDVQLGSFVAGSTGGTLTVTFEEERKATGSLILINQGEPFKSAVFGIEAPFGSTVNILNGPDVVIKGSNGGEITLSLGESSRGSSFISDAVPPDRNYISISTSLTVGTGAENPPGNYSGSLSITVIQE